MTYIRKHPWRPRSPCLRNRSGARRRGFRKDELCPSPVAWQDDTDLVVAFATEQAPLDDLVLAETVSHQVAQSTVAARVDVSGLLAIASIPPEPVSLSPKDVLSSDTGWLAYGDRGDEEFLLARNSA